MEALLILVSGLAGIALGVLISMRARRREQPRNAKRTFRRPGNVGRAMRLPTPWWKRWLP
ncbi:hypothetical protein [Sphaerisporangium aureirubrum]|uniref:LPXTG cell wall anchor domain-containing protein n=1 Tax=Sphaerisporangium aureirubrum TaxID=1544736 RepID=A0ABW1NDD5_9ACTN